MTGPFKNTAIGRGITSYDFVDIAEGAGYVKFLCGSVSNSGTLSYIMLKEDIEVGNTSPTTVDTHERRYAWDIGTQNPGTITFTTSAFNTTKTINGVVYVIFTITSPHNNSAGTTQTPAATLKRNTTQLGTVSGSGVKVPVSTSKTYCLDFSVTNQIIAKGDTLSLTITITPGNADTAQRVYILHDPKNRNVAAYTNLSAWQVPAVTATDNPTEIACYIPFKI